MFSNSWPTFARLISSISWRTPQRAISLTTQPTPPERILLQAPPHTSHLTTYHAVNPVSPPVLTPPSLLPLQPLTNPLLHKNSSNINGDVRDKRTTMQSCSVSTPVVIGYKQNKEYGTISPLNSGIVNTGSTKGGNNILYAANTKHLIGHNLIRNIIPIPLEHHKWCVYPTTTVIFDTIPTSPTNINTIDATSPIPQITVKRKWCVSKYYTSGAS